MIIIYALAVVGGVALFIVGWLVFAGLTYNERGQKS